MLDQYIPKVNPHNNSSNGIPKTMIPDNAFKFQTISTYPGYIKFSISKKMKYNIKNDIPPIQIFLLRSGLQESVDKAPKNNAIIPQ